LINVALFTLPRARTDSDSGRSSAAEGTTSDPSLSLESEDEKPPDTLSEADDLLTEPVAEDVEHWIQVKESLFKDKDSETLMDSSLDEVLRNFAQASVTLGRRLGDD
jgi:hypothetical protein